MLILGRRAGESVIIGGDVRVVVLAADRRGVRLGIEAPAQVSIVREEILQQVAIQNRRASAPPGARALVEGTGSAAANDEKENVE
ncbi:MAG: carbon storage regulator [Gemmatimonadota bacterium]